MATLRSEGSKGLDDFFGCTVSAFNLIVTFKNKANLARTPDSTVSENASEKPPVFEVPGQVVTRSMHNEMSHRCALRKSGPVNLLLLCVSVKHKGLRTGIVHFTYSFVHELRNAITPKLPALFLGNEARMYRILRRYGDSTVDFSQSRHDEGHEPSHTVAQGNHSSNARRAFQVFDRGKNCGRQCFVVHPRPCAVRDQQDVVLPTV